MNNNLSTYHLDKLKKFYYNDWFIGILIAFWIFIIPGIAGIVLLVMKTILTSKARSEYNSLCKNANQVDFLMNDNQELKSKVNTLTEKLSYTESLLTPDAKDVIALNNKKLDLEKDINDAESKLSSLTTTIKDKESELDNIINKKNTEIDKLDKTIQEKQKQILTLDDDILVQEFGIYKPLYDFANSTMYKDKLTEIRNNQKSCIKNKLAATGSKDWTVNGDKRKGNKMVSDMQKLLIRAFNSECDELINKVKYNNFDAIIKRMDSSRSAISKLGTIMDVAITDKYYKLKVEELKLALEYRIIKNEEKEAAKEARAQQREAERLEREIAEQRKKAEKEQEHYQNALKTLLEQINNTDAPSQELLDKKAEFESQLEKIDTNMKELDYREANHRAGYVYVISNIGSFGKDVYKIGMTRRLNPMERVDELGDASVPFNFDVHALIFSDDAPALENALHKAFEHKKVNMVNHRREFFHVTLDEIKKVINDNFDKTVDFTDTPDAEQYRITQTMLENNL